MADRIPAGPRVKLKTSSDRARGQSALDQKKEIFRWYKKLIRRHDHLKGHCLSTSALLVASATFCFRMLSRERSKLCCQRRTRLRDVPALVEGLSSLVR